MTTRDRLSNRRASALRQRHARQLRRERRQQQIYRAGSTKHLRRTKDDIAAVRAAIIDILENDNPQIVRQVYYALVAKDVIEKTEQEYQHTVIRLCSEMRWQDEIDWEWIVDESRIIHQTQTYDSVADAVEETAKFYRKSALRDCLDHIELWVEKAGLGSIIWEVAGDYDVPVVVSKGMPSLSQLYECSMRIIRAKRAGKARGLRFGLVAWIGGEAFTVLSEELLGHSPGSLARYGRAPRQGRTPGNATVSRAVALKGAPGRLAPTASPGRQSGDLFGRQLHCRRPTGAGPRGS
jgi:hypothetical protein